jgi:carbonyl reductase 1
MNNAGFAFTGKDPFNFQNTLYTFSINYYGTINFTKAMLAHLNDSAQIIVVGSGAGGLSRMTSDDKRAKLLDPELTLTGLDEMVDEFMDAVGADTWKAEGWPGNGYAMSKMFLHAWVRVMSRDPSLTSRGISINALCPGWVATDMGGANAPRTIEQGAETPAWLA